MRIDKVRIFTLFLFLILICGLCNLQLLKGGYYFSLANKNCIRVISHQGLRGRILDYGARVIVDNQISYDISILYNEFERSARSLRKLAGILNKSEGWINKSVKKNFVSAFIPVVVAKNASKRTAFLVEENKFDLPGIMVEISPKRRYPYDNTASHLIGYLAPIDRWRITRLKDYGYNKSDIAGFGGVEEAMEQEMRSSAGGTQVQVDHRGRINRVLGFRPAGNGKDVYLTIDIRIQKIVEEAFEGKKGAAVLMDVHTGRIIAMVSSPNFSPGSFLEPRESGYVKGLLSDEDAPLLNRAISAKYPLGSIFKVVSAIAALETGRITANKRIFCPGKISVGAKDFKCWSRHGSQDLKEAIAHSCNVYFYRIALMLGADNLTKYSHRFGLGRPTGIDLPYEAAGNVPSILSRKLKFKNWYAGDTANFGIGQGDFLVTPIQAARLMAVLANGGRLIKPYIVEAVGDEKFIPRAPADLGLNPKALKTVIEGLKQVVNLDTGTANIGDWENLKVAGKTGTAQVHGKLSHGWFAGFMPYDRAEISFCFFLEHTGQSIHAVILAQEVFLRLRKEKLI